MKKPITKAQIRAEIEQQVSDFIGGGGSVEQIQRGVSGRENCAGPVRPETSSFQQPRTERTYVPEVVATLEARRKQMGSKTSKPAKRKPRKKLIYDDFGEPLRWEWEE